MRKYSDEEIIEKARTKIQDEGQLNKDIVDITVDFEDEHELTHSYVVSFKREDAGNEWSAFDISEISTQG